MHLCEVGREMLVRRLIYDDAMFLVPPWKP